MSTLYLIFIERVLVRSRRIGIRVRHFGEGDSSNSSQVWFPWLNLEMREPESASLWNASWQLNGWGFKCHNVQMLLVNLMRIYRKQNRGSSIAKMHASEASSCVWHFCHSWRLYRVIPDHFTRYQSLNDPWKTKYQVIFLQVHCLDSFSSVRRSLNISKPTSRFETSCLQKLNWSSHSPEYTLRRCPFLYLCNWGIHLRTQAALRLLPGA